MVILVRWNSNNLFNMSWILSQPELSTKNCVVRDDIWVIWAGEINFYFYSLITHQSTKSEDLRFNFTWGFRIFSLLHACDKMRKNYFSNYDDVGYQCKPYCKCCHSPMSLRCLLKTSDQYQYLGNCPPTPPLTQQSIDNKLGLMLG